MSYAEGPLEPATIGYRESAPSKLSLIQFNAVLFDKIVRLAGDNSHEIYRVPSYHAQLNDYVTEAIIDESEEGWAYAKLNRYIVPKTEFEKAREEGCEAVPEATYTYTWSTYGVDSGNPLKVEPGQHLSAGGILARAKARHRLNSVETAIRKTQKAGRNPKVNPHVYTPILGR